jgi:hypothetical protein
VYVCEKNAVPLLRGNADYMHLAEQNRQLNERIAQLESENSRVLAEKAELSGPVSSEFTETTVNAVLQHNVEPRRCLILCVLCVCFCFSFGCVMIELFDVLKPLYVICTALYS